MAVAQTPRNVLFVYSLFLFAVLMDNCVFRCHGYNYDANTQSILCSAQCEALCLDGLSNCEDLCNGDRTWMTNCNRPNCTGTCAVLFNRFLRMRNLLPAVPTVTLKELSLKSAELSWTSPPATSMSPLANLYVIERKQHDLLSSTSNASILGWVPQTKYKVPVTDVCDQSSFRVMAINEVGSLGFSSPVHLTGMVPGYVQNIRYTGTGSGLYYYPGHAPDNISWVMAILEWSAPPGWLYRDLKPFHWNSNIRSNCSRIEQNSIPIFQHMNYTGTPNKILMKIAANSIGCHFVVEVRATSRCGVPGPWTNFTVDLTNCSIINGYNCDQNLPFNPPGLTTVKLNVTQTSDPFKIDLHIMWKPPTDLGSKGVLAGYIIRSGHAERNLFPIPPDFTEKPSTKNVAENTRELIFSLKTNKMPYTYGVQVIAVAPGQNISDNDWGTFPMYTIMIDRNTSVDPELKKGRVLLNADGVIVVFVRNTLELHFSWDMPQWRSNNVTVDRYALQWGPFVGPDQSLMAQNVTVVPGTQTSLTVFLQDCNATALYGVQIKPLKDPDEDPDAIDWDTVDIYNFTFPETLVPPWDPKSSDPPSWRVVTGSDDSFNLTPLYAIIPVVVLVAMVIILLKVAQNYRRKRFKHLEEELAEEADENGDHYYVMRSLQTGEDGDELLPPTVVPDKWELPHSCLKIGRVLGSGAFGQVVKGRVSKTLMQHRGIDVQGAENKRGTHVTVAIKMLQEYTEDRYRNDFLNEIRMMKNIGYHRNVVSILGCCTLREPYCLVVEHVTHGDLLTYLRKVRATIVQREEATGPYVNSEVDLISPLDVLSFARQVAVGMEFLAQKGFVHRDLAARNILVGSRKTVKIGDFGLARYIYHDLNKVYVNRRGGKLPLKWMAVESIFEMTFSTASDVWAFGVLLFEIVSLGGSPYPLVANENLLQELRHGYRMEKPDNCCQELYDLMLWCWRERPSERPSFSDLRRILEEMIQDDSGLEYLDFKVDSRREYYRINSDEMDTTLVSNEVSEDIDRGEVDGDSDQDPSKREAGLDVNQRPAERQNDIKSERDPIRKQNNRENRHGLAGKERRFTRGDKDLVSKQSSFRKREERVRMKLREKQTTEALAGQRLEGRVSPTSVNRFESESDACHAENCEYSGIKHDMVEDMVSMKAEDTDESHGIPHYIEGGVATTAAVNPSFHNELYQVCTGTDCTDIDGEEASVEDGDDSSRSSDEVFADCVDCQCGQPERHSCPTRESGNLFHCSRCGRTSLKLTRFDLHPTGRTDSAFSSTSESDDSEDDDTIDRPSETSDLSNEYLMPDSPSDTVPGSPTAAIQQEQHMLGKYRITPELSDEHLDLMRKYFPLTQALRDNREVQSLDCLAMVDMDFESPELRDNTPYVGVDTVQALRKYHSAPFLSVSDDEEEEEDDDDDHWSVLDTYL